MQKSLSLLEGDISQSIGMYIHNYRSPPQCPRRADTERLTPRNSDTDHVSLRLILEYPSKPLHCTLFTDTSFQERRIYQELFAGCYHRVLLI
jgi:hypothetical protein